jgi:hypothetical protein
MSGVNSGGLGGSLAVSKFNFLLLVSRFRKFKLARCPDVKSASPDSEVEKQIPTAQAAEDLLAAGKPHPEGRNDKLGDPEATRSVREKSAGGSV